MFPTITLIVTRGPLAGQRYTFNQPTACTVGRARDCTISLPLEAEHLDVSRHHCLLDISPPDVRIRDLGSLNGTYVNGRKIGQRDGHEAPSDSGRARLQAVELTAGDEVQLGGNTAFRVCILASTGARTESSRTAPGVQRRDPGVATVGKASRVAVPTSVLGEPYPCGTKKPCIN